MDVKNNAPSTCTEVPAGQTISADNTKTAKKPKPKSIIISVLIVFIGLTLIKTSFGTNGGHRYSANDLAVGCAETLVLSISKNPDSVTFHTAEVTDSDKYGKYLVFLDFSGQNGFGGYTRDRWYVIVKNVQKNGEFNYNSSFWHSEAQDLNLSVLKNLNNWDAKEDY